MQWAPLDLNQGSSEPSGHRWTSIWDLPNSAGAAGPQRPDGMPEDMSEHITENMSDRTPNSMPDRLPEDLSDKIPNRMSDNISEDISARISEDMLDKISDNISITNYINIMVGIIRNKKIYK